jgi:hypothetical protein
MSEVERFECADNQYMYSTADHVHPNWGEWVRAADYDLLAAKCAAMENDWRVVLVSSDGEMQDGDLARRLAGKWAKP